MSGVTEERIRECARTLWIEAGRPTGGPERFHQPAREKLRSEEKTYDKTVADSFPASDPPANSGITSDQDLQSGSGG